MLITGGVGGSSFFFKDSSAELYDPASQEFTLLSSFMNEPRSLHTATLLDDGSVLLAGGFSGSVAVSGGVLSGASGLTSNSAETFDPNTQDFTCVGGFNSETTRCNHSMTWRARRILPRCSPPGRRRIACSSPAESAPSIPPLTASS